MAPLYQDGAHHYECDRSPANNQLADNQLANK
jgi:hypothetical protein